MATEDYAAALEEQLIAAQRRIADLEEQVEARNRVINYWYPLLGYVTANEMVYPAVGDRRARPAPALEHAV